MEHIHTLGQLETLDLTHAENTLVKAVYACTECKLAEGDLPADCSDLPTDYGEPPDDRKVRASVLRYLLLGGCPAKPLPICTINLQGAYIIGTLDLDQQKLRHPLVLSNCRVTGEISAVGAFLPALEASSCVIQKVTLERAVVRNDISFDSSVFSERVCLSGAQIRGQLDCENATFHSSNNILGPGPNSPPYAFDGQDMRVGHGFFWKNITVLSGAVDVSLAHVGALVDDYRSWPGSGLLRLNGFTYANLANSPKDPKGRKKWLNEGSFWNGEFYPQPYTQLAKVLRDLGHDADARTILEERERLLKKEVRRALLTDSDPPSRNYVTAMIYDSWGGLHFIFADLMLKALIGYGHQPFRSLFALLVLVILAVIPAKFAYEYGDFAPNSAVIQTSTGWKEALSSSNPAHTWSAKGQPGQDWETFSPIAYGVDVVVPIISFGQTEAWAPSTTRGVWGKNLWWLEWILSTAGWIVTALGAAAITGLIRKE